MWEVKVDGPQGRLFADFGDRDGALRSGLDALASHIDAGSAKHFRELCRDARPVRMFFAASATHQIVLRKIA